MDYISEAIKVAKRSSIKKHKTGCVIVLGGRIVSNGWSHIPERPPQGLRSLHAELHALARARRRDIRGATIFVATVAGKSNNVVNGRPCLHCAIALEAAHISCYHTVALEHAKGFAFGLADFTRDFADLKVYSDADDS